MTALRQISAILAAVLAAAPFAASANTTTNTLDARLEVDTSCRVFTEPLAFGRVSFFTGQVDATAQIRLRCGPFIAYSVAIDNGQHYNGRRRMYNGGGGFFSYVNYQIYRNAARTQVWGASAADVVTGVTPADGQVTLTAYGRVPSTIALAREYLDIVTVTVTF
jgi:spore coat protein U-like protein